MNIPATAGKAREQAIVDYVQQLINSGAGTSSLGSFTEVTSTIPGHTASFAVSADALKIDGVRVGVSAETNQKIADLLGCSMLTSKMLDLMWLQRTTTLPPFPRGQAEMTTTKEMVANSAKIDAALAKMPEPHDLIATVGKAWVLDNGMLDGAGNPKKLGGVPMAVNYGWHFAGPNFQGIAGERATYGEGRVIQGRGYHHDSAWADYSQVCLLVSNHCVVDGHMTTLDMVLSDPQLAQLANVDGVLRVLRQPGVQFYGGGGVGV